MPYSTIYHPAPRFMTYKGIDIYHTYKGDDINSVQSTYHFVTEPEFGEDMSFDVRDLSTWKEPNPNATLPAKENKPKHGEAWDRFGRTKILNNAIKQAIKDAIKKGELNTNGIKQEESSSTQD